MSKKRVQGAKFSIHRFTQSQLHAALLQQSENEFLQRKMKRAHKAFKSFRARKADRGNFVFFSPKGKHITNARRAKGYLCYVSKTGKKFFIPHEQYQPKKIQDVKPVWTKRYIKAAKKFEQSKLVLTSKKKPVIVSLPKKFKQGKVRNDFDAKLVNFLAKGLSKAIHGQRSQRNFLVEAFVTVKTPDGLKVFNVEVSISKPDHQAIKLGGLKNFINHKFYAQLAKQLEYDGYVTSGSSNHVRKLKENQGLEQDEWTKDGIAWTGRHDMLTVHIVEIEFRILQQK